MERMVEQSLLQRFRNGRPGVAMKYTIRAKTTLLTISAILISVAIIGATSILMMKAEEEHDTEQIMSLICEAKCTEINDYLRSIESSSETVSRFVYESLDITAIADGGVIGATGSGRSLRNVERTAEQREGLDAYLTDHLSSVQEVCQTIADNNASILGYYYRINPEISDNAPGFWYSRHKSVNFEQLELTDINAYPIDDYNHVGWYYTALERGMPAWFGPYENGNLNLEVVSYIAPIYKYGTFIGLVGIDIDYLTLMKQVDSLEVLQTGYAFLTDEKGVVVYHPQLETGVLLSDVSSELESSDYRSEAPSFVKYSLNGVPSTATWGVLDNGLRLFVSAPDSEIGAGWQRLSWIIILVSLIIIAAFIVLTASITRRLTKPLERLVKASEHLAKGNYDVDLTYDGDDEVGTLTQSFKHMANRLQAFIKDLNSKAYRDALTRVKNKGAFDIFSYQLDEAIGKAEPETMPRFAIAMFDCNDLKPINDEYGHEKGDIYLQTACSVICTVLSHSMVFRIGGDEFVAVLEKDDVDKRDELMRNFDAKVEAVCNAATDPWEKASIAKGIAVFDPSIDANVESVLRRADANMYADKREFKETRGESSQN